MPICITGSILIVSKSGSFVHHTKVLGQPHTVTVFLEDALYVGIHLEMHHRIKNSLQSLLLGTEDRI